MAILIFLSYITLTLLRRLTSEVGRVIDVAAAFVARLFRVRAEGARSPGPGAAAVRCGDDLVRGLPALHPLDQRRQKICHVRSRASGAVVHPWNYEKPRELIHLSGASGRVPQRSLVPVDRVVDREDRV